MEAYGYIYETINLKNGKTYIGQHKSKYFDTYYFGSGILLKRAVKKYGIENFECNLIMWAYSKSELNNLENKFIEYYRPKYNNAKGGEGGNLGEEVNKKISKANKGRIFTEQHKQKLSESMKGKNLGRIVSEETRKKLSESVKGEKNGMFGKHHTEESRLKNRDTHKGKNNFMFGKHHTEETKEKMSIAAKQNMTNERKKEISESLKKYWNNKKIA
jgi:group I intron endonuclease